MLCKWRSGGVSLGEDVENYFRFRKRCHKLWS